MKCRPASSFMAIDAAMEHVFEVNSRAELLAYLKGHYDFWCPTDENVTIKFYCRDERIGWDTHLVCVDGKAALFTDGPLPEPERPRDWIFTFGCGHHLDNPWKPLGRRFVRIHGTYAGARAAMVSVFGIRWSHQYESEEAAGVAEYGYTELALPEPRETDYEALGYGETRSGEDDLPVVGIAAVLGLCMAMVHAAWDKE
jgi:hypothetical protein